MFRFPRTWQDLFFPRVAAYRPGWLVAPGLYHYQRERHGEYVRFHLRVDEDGPAILIAAASEALLLSPTGAAVAQGLLEGKSAEMLQRMLAMPQAAEIVADVSHALADLGEASARYPIFNLVDPATFERPWRLSAPFQADVVTLAHEATRGILQRLWSVWVPHVRFRPTKDADRGALVRTVTCAEDLGMIAGVRHRASWADKARLVEFAEAGLDYVVIPWGVTPSHHDCVFGSGDFDQFEHVIRETLRWEMTPVVEVALHPGLVTDFASQLEQLLASGAEHVEVMAIVDVDSQETDPQGPDPHGFSAPELRQFAGWIEELADQRNVQLIWLPPAARDGATPLADLAFKGPRAGGDVTIRVEKDGSVIPPRGAYRVAGNLLDDPWTRIWQHEAFRRYRDRVAAATRCDECPGMTICAADCPSSPRGWTFAANMDSSMADLT